MLYDYNHKEGQALTAREYQILKLMTMGKSRLEIAEALELSPNTIRNHALSIYQKLGVYSQPELMVYAINKVLAKKNKTLQNIIDALTIHDIS